MDDIKIIPVNPTKQEIKKFVRFPWKIYWNNPYWVPPLILDQVNYILKGPYHETGVMQPFMAYQGDEPVGRIVAHYDRRHNAHFNEKRGCIGFFECVDDSKIARHLFQASETWLAEQGMTEMYGPLNFLIYDASGVLIDRFDDMPVMECVYNPPYYENLFLSYGFNKKIDWHSYRFTRNQNLPTSLYKIGDRVLNNNEGIVFRNVNKKKFPEETETLRKIFNEAWEGNWGHLPLSKKQFSYFANALKMIVKSELLIIAEHRGTAVGFILTVPDINAALRKADGRLLPFGLIKMILSLRKIKRAKLFMIGVLPEYRKKGLDVVFLAESLERGKKLGYQEVDASVVVETNTRIIRMAKHFGAKHYKTFRHYSKPVTR